MQSPGITQGCRCGDSEGDAAPTSSAKASASPSLRAVRLAGWRSPTLLRTAANSFRSSATSIDSGKVADDVDAVGLEGRGEVERGLAAELHDRALAALLMVSLQARPRAQKPHESTLQPKLCQRACKANATERNCFKKILTL